MILFEIIMITLNIDNKVIGLKQLQLGFDLDCYKLFLRTR